jgi:hypothetical protein
MTGFNNPPWRKNSIQLSDSLKLKKETGLILP